MTTSVENIKAYVRAANYLAAIQIYLQENYLLADPLRPEHIKDRLLGHWGTCPGINFVYGNLNAFIQETKQETMFILGPGHGFPALQANLFLEGTLAKFDKTLPQNIDGLAHLAHDFSWPYGFPSHSNPAAPGVIVEGGELGYALATAYGAVMDNPDLLVACLIGDGEAETGPTATAWHLAKFNNPAINGVVLPILHLNGYKISGPTIFGRMSESALRSLFVGYGYEPIFVDADHPDGYEHMQTALKRAHHQIQELRQEARKSSHGYGRPPMIILRSPKGWTGIKELDGQKIEGNFLAHQVVAPNVKTNARDLAAVEKWLRSYNFNELFDERRGFSEAITSLIPIEKLRMGATKHALGGPNVFETLKVPDLAKLAIKRDTPGKVLASSMEHVGRFLKEVFSLNAKSHNFRLLSPDETYSNKLQDVFAVTDRAWLEPTKSFDQDMAPDGRVTEVLSEHSLQGLAQGYVLTGRHTVFASYEAFLQIVSSMVEQYAKFRRVANDVSWRGDVPSLNYIVTSSGWRQEHNGYSHQNPGFIDDLLLKQDTFVRVYFPADANTSLAVLKKMLASKKGINALVAGKTQEPIWRSMREAEDDLRDGLSIWDFASDNHPDVVFAAAGDYLTKETLAAMTLVRAELPTVRLRFTNITTLSCAGFGDPSNPKRAESLDHYFTADKPVIVNFHGFPQTVKQILFDYPRHAGRFFIHGYEERGSTTTPFDMQVRNKTSRYHLAIEAFQVLANVGTITRQVADVLVEKYQYKLEAHRRYIVKYGTDMPEIEEWQWSR